MKKAKNNIRTEQKTTKNIFWYILDISTSIAPFDLLTTGLAQGFFFFSLLSFPSRKSYLRCFLLLSFTSARPLLLFLCSLSWLFLFFLLFLFRLFPRSYSLFQRYIYKKEEIILGSNWWKILWFHWSCFWWFNLKRTFRKTFKIG